MNGAVRNGMKNRIGRQQIAARSKIRNVSFETRRAESRTVPLCGSATLTASGDSNSPNEVLPPKTEVRPETTVGLVEARF
jgi:hypothetical protein